MFRTDKSYDRFNRGSELSWEITAGLRTVARRLASFTARDAYSPAEREAAIELIDAICLTHAWVMNAHLRPAPPSAPSATERGRDILRVALGARGDDGAAGAELDAYLKVCGGAAGGATKKLPLLLRNVPHLSDADRSRDSSTRQLRLRARARGVRPRPRARRRRQRSRSRRFCSARRGGCRLSPTRSASRLTRGSRQ